MPVCGSFEVLPCPKLTGSTKSSNFDAGMRNVKRIVPGILIFPFLLLAACQPSGEGNEEKTATGYPDIDRATERLEASPEDPTLYLARAKAYMGYEGFDQAIGDLKEAIRLDSQYVDAWHLLADAYLDYYNSRMALNTMYAAAARFPGHTPTLLKLTEFQYILTMTKGAERTLEQIFSREPLNAEAWFWKGMILRDEGKSEDAIKAFQTATAQDPFLIDAWVECGKLLHKKKDARALSYFERAVQLDSMNAPAWHALAEYHQDRDEIDRALEVYRQLAGHVPQYVDAYFNSGILWLERDSLRKAAEQFDLTIKMDPTHARAYLARGNTRLWSGDPVGARRDFEQALILEPDWEDAKSALDQLDQTEQQQ